MKRNNSAIAEAPFPEPAPTRRPRKRGLLLLFLATLLGSLGLYRWNPFTEDLPSRQLATRKVAYEPLPAAIPTTLKIHAERSFALIDRYIDPDTRIAYSFTADQRLAYWAVVYDNAIRAMAHQQTGDLARAQATIDYFIRSTAIKKTGWIRRGDRLVARDGWIVNIVDAAEDRPGGRGIEHIAHVGPNAYLGIAAAHLYAETGEPRYLSFARSRWDLIKDLQNEDKASFNYGGVRMGPLGNPENDREQKLEFKSENPSFYDFYNGEHAADFQGFSHLLAHVDPARAAAYHHAAKLIEVWDRRIWDGRRNLFFIGTTEKRYFDANIDKWVDPGVIPMHPLDTNALKISAYGVAAMDANFGAGTAERVRQAIDDNFKVRVPVAGRDGQRDTAEGYDFVPHDERAQLVLYREEGARGDTKVRVGTGRDPILSDEWSNWVSLADLRLAADFIDAGEPGKAASYLLAYRENALENALKTAIETADGTIAYPYAHPLPDALNKPVGFGWNTHHEPYALIGASARVLGFLRFDPFLPDGGKFAIRTKLDIPDLPMIRTLQDPSRALYTEAELYLREAWQHIRRAEKGGDAEQRHWTNALAAVDRMMAEHADWAEIARRQNLSAKASKDPFPLKGQDNLTITDLEPVFRKYWALYHVGTAEFVRVMANTNLRNIARERGDEKTAMIYEDRARESARRVSTDYYYAQTYDQNGWLWQPISSLREFVDFYY